MLFHTETKIKMFNICKPYRSVHMSYCLSNNDILSSFYRTVCLIFLFSQYLSKVNLPLIAYKDKKWKVFQYPLFKLFSVSVFYIIIIMSV